MKLLIIVSLTLIAITGCGSAGGIVSPDMENLTCRQGAADNHWLWGFYQFHIPADRSCIEVEPIRFGDYHYCVTKFLEIAPCSNCLTVGPGKPQPDGTFKFDVTLRHPFPNQPRYTGFDVRGMVYFPPTTNIETYMSINEMRYITKIYSPDDQSVWLYNESMPLVFSRGKEGGGEVLNADGYSCYLIPGLEYSSVWPIYNYQPGANGIEQTPATTITPYLLFASESERRMFLVTDEITREYHIDLPVGPFTFGYAVDASWWPADNHPVNDPLKDFPRLANAEDPWKIEFEQLLPLIEENQDKENFKVTIHHRGTDWKWIAWIYAWGMVDIIPEYDPLFEYGEPVMIDEFTTEIYITVPFSWWYYFGSSLVPGNYKALIIAVAHPEPAEKTTTELAWVYAPTFVDLYVPEQ